MPDSVRDTLAQAHRSGQSTLFNYPGFGPGNSKELNPLHVFGLCMVPSNTTIFMALIQIAYHQLQSATVPADR